VREDMTLQEDKETKAALETLTSTTGLTLVSEVGVADESNVTDEVVTAAATESGAVPGIATEVSQELSDTAERMEREEDSYEIEPVNEVHKREDVTVATVNEISTPTQSTAPAPMNPLKAQLASLLGTIQQPSTAVLSAPDTKPAVLSNKPAPTHDESDLYSINKFTI
jgi:hypothetical protein